MRPALAFLLSMTACVSANATTVHHSKPLARSQRVASPKGVAVPGWTEEQTQKWMYDTSGPAPMPR
jgi:hypothetical protein